MYEEATTLHFNFAGPFHVHAFKSYIIVVHIVRSIIPN